MQLQGRCVQAGPRRRNAARGPAFAQRNNAPTDAGPSPPSVSGHGAFDSVSIGPNRRPIAVGQAARILVRRSAHAHSISFAAAAYPPATRTAPMTASQMSRRTDFRRGSPALTATDPRLMAASNRSARATAAAGSRSTAFPRKLAGQGRRITGNHRQEPRPQDRRRDHDLCPPRPGPRQGVGRKGNCGDAYCRKLPCNRFCPQ